MKERGVIMKAKKTVGLALLVGIGTIGALLASIPVPALAAGATAWNAKDMMDNAYKTGESGGSVTEIDGAVISGWVGTFTTWALGIAIAIFVLKIVLTAIDRMLFASDANGSKVMGDKTKSVLTRIPLIGAYEPDVDWKEVFIHFGKQLAIVVGAWIFVQLVVNLVMFAFGALNQ
ncbi:MAG: hypothetical protein BZ138_06385 [Methanosphaera sp. rholeuAM270]|nr:MAG: hypothetical protein BZ138_06385 [Methanosphaera sp. rholeuAM270]